MSRETGQATAEIIKKLDPFVLLPALVQATGEEELLHDAMPYAMKADRSFESLPESLRLRVAELLDKAMSDGDHSKFGSSPELLRAMVNFAAGAEVPEEYVTMLLEESGVVARAVDQLDPLPSSSEKGSHSVAIIGAGVFAIALAYYLKRAGIPFTIYEKSDRLGGTWADSRYPGCSVDTASHLYVYSFALNPDWPRYFSKQQDVLDYLERVVDKFGLREHMRFGVSIESARYDEQSRRWKLTARTSEGETQGLDANILVSCVGQLNVPSVPDIPGLQNFSGPVLHTARWPEDASLAGKRVALIGAAASAVQLGPTIAPEVKELTVFQRSPQWFSYRPNYHQSVSTEIKSAFRDIPNYINWHRLTLLWQFGDRLYPALLNDEEGRPSAANSEQRKQWESYIREKLKDRPDLLEKALPDYPPLTKRVPVDFGWLDMLKRDNVRLVTEGIEQVTPEGLITVDGTLHPVDAIVLATGYQATQMLQTVRIEGRQGSDLHQEWKQDDARAYLGMTVPGFPNFFMMYGPNTNLAHGGSLMFQSECQARFIVTALRHMAEQKVDEIECREEIFRAFNAELDQQMERTVWTTPDVSNWFKNSQGRIVNNWPWPLQAYWNRTGIFVPSEFHLR